MSTWILFLIECAAKGTIVLALAALASAWLRRGNAASRHLVWHISVVGLLALPIISAALPQGAHWAVLPRIRMDRVGALTSHTQKGVGTDNGLYSNATSGGTANSTNDRGATIASQPVNANTTVDESASSSSAPASSRGFHLPHYAPSTWVFVIWLVGALLVLARYALGTLVVHWFTWRAKPLQAVEWASLNETMSFAVGLGHPVKLLKSERATTPMTFGVLNPVVLLPFDADEWTAERRRVVLLHELAHVQRLDCLTNIFATLACAIYWFNPLVWLAVGRLRAEGERACDDWVLRAGMRASTYAEHLLDMVKTIGRVHTPAAALPMAQRSTFEGRLLAILEPDMNRNGTRRGQAVLLTSVIALVVLPLAAMTSPASAAKSASDANTTADAVAKTRLPLGDALLKHFPHLGIGMASKDDPSKSDPRANAADTNVATSINTNVQPNVQTFKSDNAWDSKGDVVSEQKLNLLFTSLRDADLDVRRESIKTLGELGDPRSVAALSAALRSDKDATVRRAAAWALGQIGDAKGVPALADALKADSDMNVRRTAAWAVGQIGDAAATDALASAVRDSDKELRSTAVWALGQIGESAGVPVLASAIKDSDTSIRNSAAWALGQIGDRAAVTPLTTALHDSDAQVRGTAVWALGQIGEDNAVAPLEGILTDSDPAVRNQAVWALGQIGSEHAVAGLTTLLSREPNAEVRETAAWALGQIGDDAAAPALGNLMKDSNASVRSDAAWALGQISHRPAPQALLDAVRDDNVEVRRNVVWALGQIEDPNSVGALRTAMKDSDADVKRVALRALARLGDDSGLDAISEMLKDSDPAVRKQAAQMLGGHGGGWVDPRPRPRPQPRPAPRPRPNGW